MKRLLSSLLAISMCLSPTLVKKTDAFSWRSKIEQLEKGCEWDKKLKRPLEKQERCIMLGQKSLDEKIEKAIEQFRNSDKLKELLQTMFNLSYKAISDARIEYFNNWWLRGGDVSDEELDASLKVLKDRLENSEEAKNLINYCKLNTERMKRNYSGAIEVPTNLTTNDEKIRASEIINNKYLSKLVCEAFPLKVIANAAENF